MMTSAASHSDPNIAQRGRHIRSAGAQSDQGAGTALEAIFTRAVVRRYKNGERIDVGRTSSDGLCIVLHGRVKLTLNDSDGHQLALGHVEAGAVISAAELTERGRAAVTATAQQACRLLQISAREIAEALNSDGAAAAQIVRGFGERLVAAHARTASLAFGDVRERVAEALLSSASDNGEGAVDCGAEEIARRVAASREMVSRVMRRMIDQGLIDRHRRKIRVIDAEGLQAILGPSTPARGLRSEIGRCGRTSSATTRRG